MSKVWRWTRKISYLGQCVGQSGFLLENPSLCLWIALRDFLSRPMLVIILIGEISLFASWTPYLHGRVFVYHKVRAVHPDRPVRMNMNHRLPRYSPTSMRSAAPVSQQRSSGILSAKASRPRRRIRALNITLKYNKTTAWITILQVQWIPWEPLIIGGCALRANLAHAHARITYILVALKHNAHRN